MNFSNVAVGGDLVFLQCVNLLRTCLANRIEHQAGGESILQEI